MNSNSTATLHPDACIGTPALAPAPAPTNAYSALEIFFNNGNPPLLIMEKLKEGCQHPFRRFATWYHACTEGRHRSQELFNFESCGSFVGLTHNNISHFVIKQFEANGKQCATTIYQEGV